MSAIGEEGRLSSHQYSITSNSIVILFYRRACTLRPGILFYKLVLQLATFSNLSSRDRYRHCKEALQLVACRHLPHFVTGNHNKVEFLPSNLKLRPSVEVPLSKDFVKVIASIQVVHHQKDICVANNNVSGPQICTHFF